MFRNPGAVFAVAIALCLCGAEVQAQAPTDLSPAPVARAQAARSAAPKLSPACVQIFQEYRRVAAPKAFAAGRSRCAYWHGAKTVEENQRNAVRSCREQGEACRLYNSVR